MPVAVRRLAAAAAVTVVAAAACASAGRRLEQGLEAEARGDYHRAALRYVDALDKDPSMAEARGALLAAGDSAVRRGLRAASELAAGEDAVGGADEYRRLDALLRGARSVGVTLPTPATYGSDRRAAFDAAISALMDQAAALRAGGRWGDAVAAYRRIRDDFEPSRAGRRESLNAEADALLDWAGADAVDGRFRAAYERAADALQVSDDLPLELVDAAGDLQQRALASGVRVLAVFPVDRASAARDAAAPELEQQLSDVLELEHWRRPPLFVAVADPVAVRRVTRRMSPPGETFRPGRVLAEVGADFGAFVEISDFEVAERDVKRHAVDARLRDGRRTSYTVEEGQARYTLGVRVTLFDERGREMESFPVRASAEGRFERARYDGDPANLDLSRDERRLFDPGEVRRRRAGTEERLVEDAARDVAAGVFDRVVRRIP